jgi:hypothetical protein
LLHKEVFQIALTPDKIFLDFYLCIGTISHFGFGKFNAHLSENFPVGARAFFVLAQPPDFDQSFGIYDIAPSEGLQKKHVFVIPAFNLRIKIEFLKRPQRLLEPDALRHDDRVISLSDKSPERLRLHEHIKPPQIQDREIPSVVHVKIQVKIKQIDPESGRACRSNIDRISDNEACQYKP